jgi:hypothetical protein
MNLQVSSKAAPSGSPGDLAPGFPGTSIFQRRLRRISGLPRLFGPLAAPAMDLQVAPNLSSSGCAASASSGFPESCVYGWVDDESPACLELCILGLSRG